jgi:hypothetical protein
MNTRATNLVIMVVVGVVFVIAACSPARNTPTAALQAPDATPSPTPIWSGLLQKTPYPYTTPLPRAQVTILDGIYTKVEPGQVNATPLPEGGIWMPHPVIEGRHWIKPVPYPLEGGAWRLQLEMGIFRIFHKASGWRTLGSFTVSEDRITFFNDPHCYDAVGSYTWKLSGDQLMLEVIADECDGRVLGGGGLRVTNLSSQPWVLDNSNDDE